MLRLLSLSLAAACASAAVSQMLPNRAGLSLDEASVWVINTTRVSRQIKLDTAQQGRVSGAFDSYDRSQQAIYAKGAPTDAQTDALDHKLASSVLGILNEKQKTRLHQIALQLSGPFILAQDNIASQVGLTAPQKAKVQAIVRAERKREEAFEDSQTTILLAHPNSPSSEQRQLLAPFDARRHQIKALKAGDEMKIVRQLNKEQSAKWSAMLGPKMQ